MLIIHLTAAVLLTNKAYGDKKQDTSNTRVVLTPKIISSQVLPVKYELQADILLPYLESIFILEDLSIPKLKAKPIFKKPYVKDGKIIIDSPYFTAGKFMIGLKDALFAKKKLKKSSNISKRYVLRLENEEQKLASKNDVVLVAGIDKEQYSQYIFVEARDHCYHPVTKEYLGTIIFVIGKGSVLKREEVSFVQIDQVILPIKPGTIVMPSRNIKLLDKIQATETGNKMSGQVISLISGMQVGGMNNVALLNLGLKDGVKIGQIFQAKINKLQVADPYNSKKKYTINLDKVKGEMVVYDVFNKVSLALIVKGHEQIKALDQVE